MQGSNSSADSVDIEGYQQGGSPNRRSEPETKQRSFAFLILPVTVIICGSLLIASRHTSTSTAVSKIFSSSISYSKLPYPTEDQIVYVASTDIFMEATNEYGQYNGVYSYFNNYPGAQLIEPYKESTITLKGPLVDAGYSFLWQIEGDEIYRTGTSNVFTVTRSGIIPVSFHAFDSKGSYHSTFATTLIAKYVKRELRTLTEADREAFLDAAHKMWELSTEEGRAIYGDKFTSIHTFTKEHALASGDIMCDQFHEGSGFLTHHLAISNSFEASLRAVNPAVSLHYWDFTREGEEITRLGYTASYLSKVTPFLSDTWFGSVDDSNHIANSRWAHSRMPKLDSSDLNTEVTNSHNSYGYMRSYWNNNPDPEVVRHLFDVCGMTVDKTIPNCADHFELINTATLDDFMTLSPSDGHGPMHVQLGGVFGGCTDAYAAFNSKWGDYLDRKMSDEDIVLAGYDPTEFNAEYGTKGQRRSIFNKSVMGEYFHIYRTLWRSHMCATDGTANLLECPESCDASTDFSECTCSVKKLTSGETTWKNILPCFVENDSMQKLFNAVFNSVFLEDLVTMVSTSTTLEGEMLHAGSPADILFWVIHPTIERVMTAKRMDAVTAFGGAPFAKFADGVTEDKSSWTEYSHYTIEAGENVAYPEGYHCYGHAADDQALPERLPYTDTVFDGGADVDGDGHISNWEFFLLLDPNSATSTDYVFDNFEWDHCGEATSSSSVFAAILRDADAASTTTSSSRRSRRSRRM